MLVVSRSTLREREGERASERARARERDEERMDAADKLRSQCCKMQERGIERERRRVRVCVGT